MRQASVQILSAASNGSANGSAFAVPQAVSASFQVYGTNGDEAGTLKIQGSNDVIVDNSAPSNWSDITNASVSVASGAAAFIVISSMNFAYIRAVYTRSGGGAANKLIKCQMNYLSV